MCDYLYYICPYYFLSLQSSAERMEEEISEINVTLADVHKKVKSVISSKDTDAGNANPLKELAEVKTMLAEHNKMLAGHKKKQDYIVTLLHHVCSKLPGPFPVATASGNVYTAETDRVTNGGEVYTLESSLPYWYTASSDDYI